MSDVTNLNALIERLLESAHAISQYNPEDAPTGELLCEAAQALRTLAERQPDPNGKAENKAGGLWYRRWFKATEELKAAEQRGADRAFEEAAGLVESWVKDASSMLLACGEMSAPEIRLIKAVLKQRAAAIRQRRGGQ